MNFGGTARQLPENSAKRAFSNVGNCQLADSVEAKLEMVFISAFYNETDPNLPQNEQRTGKLKYFT
jgi:hypothetical protein